MAFRRPERRLRTRYRVRVPFTLKGTEQPVRGTTRNISLLGISAYAESSLPQVHPVQCLLDIPSKPEPLAVNGTVIRCSPSQSPHPDGPYEIGVFFKDFQGGGENELMRFLTQVADQEQEAIKDGYRELKQRMATRKRKKRSEALRKLKRKKERLRKRRLRLAKEKRAKARRAKQAQARKQARAQAKRRPRKTAAAKNAKTRTVKSSKKS
jgi:hypothetical protein